MTKIILNMTVISRIHMHSICLELFLYIFGMATVFKFVVWLPLGSRHPLVTSCPLVLVVVVGGGGSARAHVHNPISYVEIRYADSVHLLYLVTMDFKPSVSVLFGHYSLPRRRILTKLGRTKFEKTT